MLAERLIAQMIAKRASQRAQEAPTQPFNNQVARTQEPLGETIESTLSATLTEADSLEDKEKMTSKSISPPHPVDGLPPPHPVDRLSPPHPADAATDNVDNEEPMPMLVDESDDEFEETPRKKKKREKNKSGYPSPPPVSKSLSDDSWIIQDGIGWTKSVFPFLEHN